MRLLLVLLASLMMPLSYAAPQRVVSLDLCMDWLLAYYASPEQVTALSPLHLRYPVAWLNSHWPSHDGSLEQVIALKPSRVLVGQYSASLMRKRLSELGVEVEVFPLPQTLAQVHAYEQQFLRSIGLPETLASEIPPLSSPHVQGKRLLLLGPNGIGTGKDTLEDEILTRAGWSNYLQSSGYQRLDLEHVVNDPPDAILWAAPDHQALANQFAAHPALHRAVAAEQWLSTDYWRWQCPGPWTWQLIGQLKQWLD